VFDIEQVTDEQLYEHLRYVRLKQHWYHAVFQEFDENGHPKVATVYGGYPEECISIPRIDELKRDCQRRYGMTDKAFLLNVSYLGYMTKAQMQGASNDN
jgi:hypothetical protein